MNVSGEFTVNAPRDVVYRTLRDANSFVRFVDGVQDLKEIDPTHYEAVFETLGDRGQDRGHAAGRGWAPDREVDHQAGRRGP